MAIPQPPPAYAPQAGAMHQGMPSAPTMQAGQMDPPVKNAPVTVERAANGADPVKSADLCGSMTLKTKLVLAMMAVFCVLVAIIVPTVIATTRDSGGVTSVSSQSVLAKQQSIPEGTFEYKTFESCNDLAVHMEAENVAGVTTPIDQTVTYVVDPGWDSNYSPAPSDWCEYCDCSSAPPRNEWNFGGPVMASAVMEDAPAAADTSTKSATAGGAGGDASGSTLSGTNNQVQGVDEADIVKTDGTHVFVAAARSQLVIATALPLSEASVLSTLDLKSFGLSVWQPADMLVSSDGNSLLVIGHISLTSSGGGVQDWVQSTVVLYIDVTDKANPTAVSADQIEGSYSTARLSGNHAYVIVNTYPSIQWVAERRNGPIPPLSRFKTSGGGQARAQAPRPPLPPPRVRDPPHVLVGGCAFQGHLQQLWGGEDVDNTIVDAWVSVLSVDLTPGGEKRGESTVLTHAGRGGTVFASAENIFIAAPNYNYAVVLMFAMNNGAPAYRAKAEVPGTLINQFAMDEHNGHLRVATTDGEVWSDPPTSTNAVYVFDSDMKPTGAVEGMAPGERIYAVRFAGERGYVVTFRQVDPLFVLDLSDAKSPKQLGQLKVPGFSEYLHPVDKDTIVGVGKETKTEPNGRTTTTGVKVSLFDISDPSSPKEAAVRVVGGAGSSTPVSYEHKAFTFNPSTGLMAFPISEAGASYRTVYDGVYVWRVSGGELALLGRTTQSVRDYASDESWWYGYGDDVRSIKRSLYIEGGEGGETLLTFSQRQFRAHRVDDLSLDEEAEPVAKLDLTTPDCSDIPWQ
eukprot:CAMPEP_0172086380 /NCGR_PEP_ID=MMETSP1043-20130122/22099_1 /TAXON_ID=464988 /ORGANISM="Hemiselmis andersenii, Strain CCMP441" /LENGTH=796 /DNA_ID=CAMNT_0012748473 /DNA_START=156 /DNA_END=2548 /DNA_ORIENTATION=-